MISAFITVHFGRFHWEAVVAGHIAVVVAVAVDRAAVVFAGKAAVAAVRREAAVARSHHKEAACKAVDYHPGGSQRQ